MSLKNNHYFDVSLIVYLRIILANDQLNAQILIRPAAARLLRS